MRRRVDKLSIRQRLGLAGGLLLWGALQTGGCAAGWPAVLDPSDIVELREGRPRLERVRDLGAVHIGRAGQLAAESDGKFAIGELVLLEGSGFGKQPTVTIGGRPAELRWRTEGGGIVVKVPASSAVGRQSVLVQNSGGKSEAQVVIGRLALVLDRRRGQLHTLRIGRDEGGNPTVGSDGPPLLVAGARAVALSYDGAAAYVLADDGALSSVAVVDLVAPGGPRLVDSRRLSHRAGFLAAAEQAGVLAIVGDEKLTLWDVSEGRRPATWPAALLPEAVQKPRAAALSPDGSQLALSLASDNQLALLAVQPGHTTVTPRPLAQLAVLPGLRQPLLQGLRFSSDGTTLWLSAGDNPDSLAAGHQPTRIIAVELKPAASDAASPAGDLGIAVLKSVDLRDAGPPLQLALGKSPPLAAGTAIRTPPEKATIFLTTGPSSSADKVGKSALWRSDLLGHLAPLYSSKEQLGALDVSPDAKLAVTARLGSNSDERTLTVTDLETSAAATFPLGPSDEAERKSATSGLQVLLQP